MEKKQKFFIKNPEFEPAAETIADHIEALMQAALEQMEVTKKTAARYWEDEGGLLCLSFHALDPVGYAHSTGFLWVIPILQMAEARGYSWEMLCGSVKGTSATTVIKLMPPGYKKKQ